MVGSKNSLAALHYMQRRGDFVNVTYPTAGVDAQDSGYAER